MGGEYFLTSEKKGEEEEKEEKEIASFILLPHIYVLYYCRHD